VRLPQRDRHATGAHSTAHLRLRRGNGVQLRAEEVDPLGSPGIPRRRRRTWPPARWRSARSCAAPRRSRSTARGRSGSPAPRSRARGSGRS
jgi:hypothetical protein